MKSIPARQLNELVDLGRELVGTNNPRQKQPHGKGSQLRRLILDTVDNDTLICYDPSDIGQTNPITVAKPYELQRTPFDGNTVDGITYSYSDEVTRVASNGTASETQRVTPSFEEGGFIYVSTRLVGGTDTVDEASQSTTLQALAQGRAWAADLSVLDPFTRIPLAEA